MHGKNTFQHECPVYSAIDILQEKWTLHIVRNLLSGPKGFNELSRSVGGCNPATMAQRVERLVSLGILNKTVVSTMPPKVSYELTEVGMGLHDVVKAVEVWSISLKTSRQLAACEAVEQPIK